MSAPRKVKKIHSELPSKCNFFFGPCFGQIWPSLVQIFGPKDFKMSKVKFLNNWDLLWQLSVVFSVNPNYYIPPSNRKCNVHCAVLPLADLAVISKGMYQTTPNFLNFTSNIHTFLWQTYFFWFLLFPWKKINVKNFVRLQKWWFFTKTVQNHFFLLQKRTFFFQICNQYDLRNFLMYTTCL